MSAGGKGAGVGAVLAEHDWFTPRGYAWTCCNCGAEFQGGEDEAYAHVAAALEAAGYGDATEVRRYAEMMRDSISVDRAEMADDILAILDDTLTARAEQQAHSGGTP